MEQLAFSLSGVVFSFPALVPAGPVTTSASVVAGFAQLPLFDLADPTTYQAAA